MQRSSENDDVPKSRARERETSGTSSEGGIGGESRSVSGPLCFPFRPRPLAETSPSRQCSPSPSSPSQSSTVDASRRSAPKARRALFFVTEAGDWRAG
ncbi:hypothetical protein BCR35DRAFT_310402 [Leucosporidium creatinivorum]|uniref:Uncharacterized protein n=1 Tax=Leucosporidium creatinivorum TaxID=106004 RepID=A0A1Y2D4Q7_9BASI|nr:hypothetical protein BCR35DRAFT_310402 [Leucosporidium creatinivorum]